MKTIYDSLDISAEDDKYDIRDKIAEFMKKYFDNDDNYHAFHGISNPLNQDHVINAMLMLQPYSKHDTILAASEHDCIYFDVDIVKMAQHVDENFLNDLHRSAVRWDDDGFQMFT